ncbi:MAG TPA: PhoH family protein [Gammaproteobacteria bacterium]|nr:PhoH family protein [Gammaproteobacteria bacterium]
MKKPRHTLEMTLTPFDNKRLADLCGQFDEHLHQIERYWGVEINNRGNVFQIIGTKRSVNKTEAILTRLFEETAHPNQVNLAKIHVLLQAIDQQSEHKKPPPDYNEFVIKTRLVKIRPRNPNQFHYIKNIQSHDISFGVGPSGTGKTYLAVAEAVTSLENDKVQRIILVRPAVEAGERLGFLPGDMAQKVDPYLRPLYDALYEMLGIEQVDKLIERNIIEVAPLAYMRGRTLNEAFIILDEAQNTTREQMKMFLTRIGFGSKAVITGDITQIDLPKNEFSGLRHAIAVLNEIKDIHFTFFQARDVVRHPIVQLIIQAYEKAEK